MSVTGHRRRMMIRTVAAGAVIVLFVGSCSNDDAEEDASAAGSSTTLALSGEGDLIAFCDALVGFDGSAAAGGPETSNVPAIETSLLAVEKSAPPDIRETVELYARLTRSAYGGEGEVLDGPMFIDSQVAIDQYAVANCGVTPLSLTAVEYDYRGVPDSLPAGRVALSLTNEGSELHEAALVPIGEFDGSVLEFLEVYADQDLSVVATTSRAVASPGQSDIAFVDLGPGRYGLVCFIPVGSSPGVDEQEVLLNPPHYAEGMVAEFVVE